MGNLWNAFIDGYNESGPAPESGDSAWDTLMSGTSPTPPKPPGSPRGGVVDEQYVVAGLMDRGLPQHVAEGFAMNMADESGFDSGINEINPLVKGSRGGFGLYQLTGPRRRQYEAYAEAKGVPASDPDAQMDFLMWELDNTEKSAAQDIFSTSTSGEAGAAIVNKFLRPAQSHRTKRASKYLSGSVTRAPSSPQRLWLDF